MKITAKSRYALRVLLDLAVNGDGGSRTIREVAESQTISEKFIGRIVVPLRRAGLLDTERGAGGGLRLARFPDKITLLDIVQATDGPLALLRCLARPGTCSRQGKCAAETAWRGVNDALVEALNGVRLSDVVATHTRLAPKAPTAEPDYCI
ncbi:MAG: Rrf2 family transcriptional regulator [Kiritimatiellae bacterium]|nr:Rrf2 family transcriptional regulator [Kiritimatiellia bacterium]